MKYILIVFIILVKYNSFSQNIIIDSETNKGIPYTHIAFKNTEKGFYANKKGEFTISNTIEESEFTIKSAIKVGDTLVFSALGYNDLELVYKAKEQLKSIFLIKKVEELKEVIINSNNKYEIEEIGITEKGSKDKGGTLSIIKLAVFVKNNLRQRDGIIQKLFFKKLKTKFNSNACKMDKNTPMKCVGNKRVKIENNLAVKIQLYTIDKLTNLPDLKSPLINKDIIISLNKNTKKLEYDISSYYITMPKSGVFLTLEVLGVYNDKGEIINPKGANIFRLGGSNKGDIVTYGKYKERPWSKRHANALFSLTVKYSVD